MIDLTTNVDVTQMQADKLKKLDTLNLEENRLKDVCNDFEAFFMQQLMDISLKSSNVAGEGTGSDIVKGMYTESITKQSTGSLGISDMLYKSLSEKS